MAIEMPKKVEEGRSMRVPHERNLLPPFAGGSPPRLSIVPLLQHCSIA
jgi:hypothetical protein